MSSIGRRLVVAALGSLSAAGTLFVGCGSDEATFDVFDTDGSVSAEASGGGGDATGAFGDAGLTDSRARGCVNLQCYQVQCGGDEITTTITGRVYDPAGKNPLYNAIVYVPNAPLAPVPDGLTCDTCGVLASGAPIAVAITEPDGSFELKNVPANIDFPLVIQIGKWRREVTLPKASACQSTAITNIDLTRLPRNQGEGNIPRMAIATGGADPFECLLRKIGIDDAEFTLPSGSGRVHVYQAHGGVALPLPDGGPADAAAVSDAASDADADAALTDAADAATPPASELWSDPLHMKTYDIVMLPCEGSEYPDEKDAGRSPLLDYVNAGGRTFVTHYAYTWLEDSPQPLPSVANWEHNENDRSDKAGANPILVASLDTSFPKGKAFADWLDNVGGSSDAGYGTLAMEEWRHDVESINKPPSQRWIHADTRVAWPPQLAPSGARDVVQHFTFNTPIEAGVDDAGQPLQCGKVVFSDFHVSAAQRISGKPFPASCKSDPMSPQEKALEFMLFDLSACIQKEDQEPPLPPVK